MKKYFFFKNHNYFFLLLLIYALAELIVRPYGNYPLNDDWSYAKSVLIMDNEGKFDIGDWPAMTLASHLVWGFLFVKVFGFSFIVLRISTLVSAVIGLWTLNQLVLKITGNKMTAFVACLALLFNPVFFSVSNTFMTDTNFLTLLILSFYAAWCFFTTRKTVYFLLVFFLSLMLVLLRQYGLIVPVCFTVGCFFMQQRKMLFVVSAIAGTIIIYAAFRYYEMYLKSVLPPWAAYKFSGTINPTQRVFWDTLFEGIKGRYRIILLQATVYVFPFAIIYTPSLVKEFKFRFVTILSVVVFCVVYFLYKEINFQVGNVFNDTSVGADTSYETLKGTYGEFPHFFSRGFEDIVTPIKYITISWTLIIAILFAVKLYRSQIKPFKSPYIIFLLSFFVSYCLLIVITETFFDRYQLPVILSFMILLTFMQKVADINPRWAILPLACLMYVSIAGSRDYFKVNNLKWHAYYYLRQEKGIPMEDINGGFEVNCWSEGKKSMWYDFMDLAKFNYLIQYRQEDGFTKMKEYDFQRYFPYKKDTLRIYERVEKIRKQ